MEPGRLLPNIPTSSSSSCSASPRRLHQPYNESVRMGGLPLVFFHSLIPALPFPAPTPAMAQDPWMQPQLLLCTLWLPSHDKLCPGSVICVSSNFPLIHLYILDGKHGPGAAINQGAAGATKTRPASWESLEHAERWGPGQDSNPGDALVRGGYGVWEQVQPFLGVLPALAQPSQCRDRQEPELCAGHQASSGQCPLPKTSP